MAAGVVAAEKECAVDPVGMAPVRPIGRMPIVRYLPPEHEGERDGEHADRNKPPRLKKKNEKRRMRRMRRTRRTSKKNNEGGV